LYPTFECIVDPDDVNAGNNDPQNFGTNVVFCKDSGDDDLDETPSELTQDDRYRDRVNE
jgi:hypothetical protein